MVLRVAVTVALTVAVAVAVAVAGRRGLATCHYQYGLAGLGVH